MVFDPTQYGIQILQYANQVAQYGKQVQEYLKMVEMYENQILMYQNMVKNIRNLDFSAIPYIGGVLTDLKRVVGKGVGIAFNEIEIHKQFDELYPRFHTPDGLGNHAWTGVTLRGTEFNWNKQIRDAFKTAMEAQAQMIRNVDLGQAGTQDALRKAQTAAGNMQISQAQAALQGVANAQLMEIQQLMTVQQRAEASKAMMEAAQTDQALLNSQRAMKGWGTMQEVDGLRQMPILSYR